jgi:hypothetical protein
MRADGRMPPHNRARSLVSEFVIASRIIAKRWGPPRSLRPFAGEPLGVWILALLGLAIPTGVAFVLFRR